MKLLSFLWIISTVLTGIIIQFLSGLFNTDLFSWSFLFVLPAGAFGTAYLNLFILGVFYRIFKTDPKGGLLFNSVLSTLIIIFMLAFYDPAQTLVKDRAASSGSSKRFIYFPSFSSFNNFFKFLYSIFVMSQ